MLDISPDNKISERQMLEYAKELQRYIKVKHPGELLCCMRGILETNDKIAITSFNGFGGIILPYLKAIGLTKQEIESIHIEYGRCPPTIEEHKILGKSLHIQGAMKYFGIDSKSAVTLIDDCPINIDVAQRSGYNVVLVPQGISDKSYFDVLPSSTKIYIFQNENFLISLFILRELIENHVTINYCFREIIKPLISPIMPEAIKNIEVSNYFLNNTMLLGVHLTINLASIPFFSAKDVALSTAMFAAVFSTALYTAKLQLYSCLKEQKNNNIKAVTNYSIDDPLDFITKCGSDMLIQGGVGVSSVINSKLLFPEIGWGILGIEMFSNIALGGMECYVTYKEINEEKERGYADIVLPYLADIYYIAKFAKQFSLPSDGLSHGLFIIKKDFMLLNGLMLTDCLSQLTISALPDGLKEHYINQPIKYLVDQVEDIKEIMLSKTIELIDDVYISILQLIGSDSYEDKPEL